MPWLEITTFEDEVLARLKYVLNDSIEIDEELMSVPTTQITLPIEYYDLVAHGLKKIKIHFNGNIFNGIVFGVDTNNEDETIDISLTHFASSWNFRQVPTNKAIKAKKIPDIYKDDDFVYDKTWTFNYDDVAKEEEIDYVYSRQGKLDALTQTMNLTDTLWWRIPLNKEKQFDVGEFGEDSGYFLSTKSPSKKGIQIISEPKITEDYSNVINLATVYSDKSDGGVTSLSLREVYNDKDLQDDKFPVVIINNNINNERDYDYADYPKVAPNTQLEYAVMDTESIALESGYLREGSFAFNDLSPFSIEEVTTEQNELTTKWIVPHEQRYLTEEESFNNYKCIYEYFRGKWSDLAIAGFCGAISGESGGNPNIFQNLNQFSLPTQYEGFGLVGWTPYTRITNWLNERGYSVDQYGVAECIKIEEEWNRNATNAEWIPTSSYNVTFKEWSQLTDKPMEWMVYAWLLDYGRGVWSLVAPTVPKRVAVGNRVLALIQNDWSKSYTTTTSSPSTSTGSGVYKPHQFFNTWNGKSIDFDGGFGAQCTDLWRKCMSDIGGDIGLITGDGYAHSIWNMDYSKTCVKRSKGQGQYGDWAIFGFGGNTPASHVAMLVSENGNGTVTIFGQNQGAPYCNTITISDSSLLGYWHVKDELWGEDVSTTTTINEPVDKTVSTISDEDRILAGETVYNAVIKKLINARRTYQITVDTTCLPSDLQVGMKIKFFYSNSIYKLENCGGYMKKILTLNNDFYITKMSRKVDANGDETGSLTLEKYLRIDREVQKE